MQNNGGSKKKAKTGKGKTEDMPPKHIAQTTTGRKETKLKGQSNVSFNNFCWPKEKQVWLWELIKAVQFRT